jgi:hypothetical protein
MSLMTSKVPRSLEIKTKLFGFELGDLVIVFFYLAASNLVFGQTSLKLVMVWIGTLVLASALYFTKRGKPDNHLKHLGEYWRAPGILSAGAPDKQYQPYLTIQLKEDENGTKEN